MFLLLLIYFKGLSDFDRDNTFKLFQEVSQMIIGKNCLVINSSYSNCQSIEEFFLETLNSITYQTTQRKGKKNQIYRGQFNDNLKIEGLLDLEEIILEYSLNPCHPQYISSFVKVIQEKIVTEIKNNQLESNSSISCVIVIRYAEVFQSSASSTLLGDILTTLQQNFTIPTVVILVHTNSRSLPFPLLSSISDKIQFISPIIETVSPLTLLNSVFNQLLHPIQEDMCNFPVLLSPECLSWIKSEFIHTKQCVYTAINRYFNIF